MHQWNKSHPSGWLFYESMKICFWERKPVIRSHSGIRATTAPSQRNSTTVIKQSNATVVHFHCPSGALQLVTILACPHASVRAATCVQECTLFMLTQFRFISFIHSFTHRFRMAFKNPLHKPHHSFLNDTYSSTFYSLHSHFAPHTSHFISVHSCPPAACLLMCSPCGHMLRLGTACTRPTLIPSVCMRQYPHCASSISCDISLSAPACGTRYATSVHTSLPWL